MKKLTAILLSALIIISCMSIMSVTASTEDGNTAIITADGKEYTVNVGSTLTYTVNLKTQHNVTNGEFYLGYPQSILNVADNSAVDFPVIGKNNVVYNFTENLENEFRFNFSNQSNPYDFTNGGVLITISFKVTAAGNGEIGFINENTTAQSGKLTRETVLSWIDKNYVINDELPNSEFTTSVEIPAEPTSSTEATQATESTQDTEATQATEVTQSTESTPTQPTESTQATEAPETSITVKAASTKLYVGASTKVTATVKKGVGTTTFSSSNTKVATVKVSGNVATVTGKTAGTVTIKAVNNSKSASVKITFVKKSQSVTVKAASKTLKAATVKKKAQTFKAITVKNAKGTVTYQKKSGSSKITVNKKTGKITVKKGTKKGKYTVKVTVTSASTTVYNKQSKIATIKITIK